MNARERIAVTMFLAMVVGLLTAAPAAAAGGVSPGALDRFAVVEARCPTFSWEASADADAFELVAFALPAGLEPEQVVDSYLTADTEVLYQRLPGGATGWTPSAEQCLAPGGRYVWFVRAQSGGEPSPWSEGRYFAVPGPPSTAELARALEVLQRYQDAGGDPIEPTQTAAAATRRSASAASAPKGGGSGGPKSVPTAPAAVRGDNADSVGELYGVVGTSASAQGAGVGAANTAGGPDLVLDGSAGGAADTLLSEWGVDRPSAVDETFVMTNSGSGRLHVQVEADLTADVVRTEEVVVNGMTVIDDSGAWLGAGSTVPCAGCVTSADIADGSIIDNDLADDAVTESKIEHGAVSTTHLQNNSVTSVKIADAAITSADLADESVTGGKIVDGAVGGTHLATGSVTTGKILDGTVAEADLADRAVTGAKIANGVVGSIHLATGSVTTGKILDGTVTAADVSLMGGIYVSKSQIYVNTDTITIDILNGAGWVSAYCNDANDLPLFGACRVDTAGMEAIGSEMIDWDSLTQPAEFECKFRCLVNWANTGTVMIACIDVP